MASDSDDDARSFGSEPDFGAMSALRVTTEAGPSAFAHVFDELLEDTPRGFGHDLEAADTARLQAALDAFDERVYLEREDSDPDEAARSPERRARPRRVHADRQTTRPVGEQAREWRATVPHVRVRGRALLPPTSTRDPLALEGVHAVPAPATPSTRAADHDPDLDHPDSAPWIRAMDANPGEWWGTLEDAPRLVVRGRAASPSDHPPPPPDPDEEIFAAHGELVETFAEDVWTKRVRDGDGDVGDGPPSPSPSSPSPSSPSPSYPTSPSPSPRERRRIAAGLPSIDPRVVIALDLAFARGALKAGEAEPPPDPTLGCERAIVFDSDDEDEGRRPTGETRGGETAPRGETVASWSHSGSGGVSDASEWSDADSEELRYWSGATAGGSTIASAAAANDG